MPAREWLSARMRSALVLASTLAAVIMVLLFHWVLGTGVVFTHFFYIPIVMAVVWWRWRGLFVALSLVAFLSLSDLVKGDMATLVEDLLRGGVMLLVTAVTYTLNERAISWAEGMQRTNIELESRVEERTAQLKEANTQLECELERRASAEELLARERHKLETTLRSIADGVVVADRDGMVAMMNPAAESMTGWSLAEASGLAMNDVVNIIDERTGERILHGKPGINDFQGDPGRSTVLIKRSGGRIRIADSMAPIVMGGRCIGTVAVLTDITERERLKEELWEHQHYHSMELLAGGVAHDFGNFLLALAGNLELLRPGVQDPKALERIAGIEKAMENARGLTKQLMAFSRIGSPSQEGTDISSALGDVARFNLAGSEVALRMEVEEGLSEVFMDKTHLSQVVGNVIINAKQAMGLKGMIEIRAWNADVRESDRLRPGHYVVIEISDNGPGMTEDVLRDVFEPYFTKKKEGAGLGMAITKYIVSKHGGMIEASSKPGQGTTFTLHLPAASCRLP